MRAFLATGKPNGGGCAAVLPVSLRSSTRRRCIRLAACTRGAYWITGKLYTCRLAAFIRAFKRYNLFFHTHGGNVFNLLNWRLLTFPVPVAFHSLRRTNLSGVLLFTFAVIGYPQRRRAPCFLRVSLETARACRAVLCLAHVGVYYGFKRIRAPRKVRTLRRCSLVLETFARSLARIVSAVCGSFPSVPCVFQHWRRVYTDF